MWLNNHEDSNHSTPELDGQVLAEMGIDIQVLESKDIQAILRTFLRTSLKFWSSWSENELGYFKGDPKYQLMWREKNFQIWGRTATIIYYWETGYPATYIPNSPPPVTMRLDGVDIVDYQLVLKIVIPFLHKYVRVYQQSKSESRRRIEWARQAIGDELRRWGF